MSERPKKIWVDVPEAFISVLNQEDTAYIRANLFYSVRDALKEMCKEFRQLDLPYGSKAYDQATTALNKVWDIERIEK